MDDSKTRTPPVKHTMRWYNGVNLAQAQAFKPSKRPDTARQSVDTRTRIFSEGLPPNDTDQVVAYYASLRNGKLAFGRYDTARVPLCCLLDIAAYRAWPHATRQTAPQNAEQTLLMRLQSPLLAAPPLHPHAWHAPTPRPARSTRLAARGMLTYSSTATQAASAQRSTRCVRARE